MSFGDLHIQIRHNSEEITVHKKIYKISVAALAAWLCTGISRKTAQGCRCRTEGRTDLR